MNRLLRSPLAWAGLCLGLSACTASPSPLAPAFSGSVGAPHNGVLSGAIELPVQGQGYRRYRPRANTYFGLPRLVHGIERVADRVAQEYPGGAPLIVGDLSVKDGGRISRHNSHRTGRDVDFLFYLTSPRGVPLENPGFHTLEADGFVHLPDHRYARLDIARQWALVRALLEDPELDVQFLFVSRELEALIIDYALAKSTDLALIWHAQTVLLQPGDSLPHGDHMHLRIACKPDESVQGCSGGGPHWPWLEPLPRSLEFDEALLGELAQSDPFLLGPLPPGSPVFTDEQLPVAGTAATAGGSGDTLSWRDEAGAGRASAGRASAVQASAGQAEGYGD